MNPSFNNNSCTCDRCISACHRKPGWFRHGEAEKVAEFLGISLKELFDTKLMVDWDRCSNEETTFVLSPGVVHGNLGSEFPGNPEGKCIFLDKKHRCSIHKVKPFECREALLCSSDKLQYEAKICRDFEDLIKDWRNHQDQIRELLEREPEATPYFSLNHFLGLPF